MLVRSRCLGKEDEYSRHGDTCSLVVQDRFTMWIGSYPAKSKDSNETTESLRHFVGPVDKSQLKMFYSDGAGELHKSATNIGFQHEPSTPHRPQSNGVAENAVRRVLEGTRAVLFASGLSHAWWREATRAYAYMRNIHDKVHSNKTPYEHRFNEPFPGIIVPFGCLIEYKPRAEKEVDQVFKFDKRTLPGNFMGYHARHGGRWSGDYLVIDVAAYSSAPDKRGVYVHRVKEIIKHDNKLPYQGW